MPADLAGGLGAVALFAVPGYALTEVFPTLRRLPWPRRAAYGYLLGVTTVAGSLYALSHAAGVPLRPPAVWTAAAMPALAGLAAALVRRRRAAKARLRRTGAPPLGPAAAACTLAAAFICLGVLAEAATNPPHDWDGRMTWCAQARYVRAAGTVDAGVLRDGRWYVTHPQYPLLLPLAQVAALEAFGADPDSHLPRAIYAAFLPVLLLLVYDGGRRVAGPAAAALAALAAAAAPFVIRGEGGAESTYSDLPLACFYGAALVLLLTPRPRAESGLAAGLLLAAAALTKNEGTALACLALALGWRFGATGAAARARSAPAAEGTRARAGAWRFAVAGAPLVLALALFASWRAGIPNREDEAYPELIHAGDLWPGIAAHARAAAPVLFDKMNRYRHWAGFWWAVPAVLVAGRRALRHPRVRRYLAAALGPPAVAWAAYSIYPRPAVLAAVTWERFLLQATVPLLIVLATAIAELRRHLARQPASQGDSPASG